MLRPSILLNTLPKSGSIYLSRVLSRLLRMPMKRLGTSSFGDDRIVPPWLDEFSRGNALALQHLPAARANTFLLRHYQVRRFVLHVRDPRQACLSWVRFIETQEADRAPRAALLPDAKPVREFWLEHVRYHGVEGALHLAGKGYGWLSKWWRPPPAEYNVRVNMRAIYDVPEAYWGWPLERRVDWALEWHLPALVRWLEGWAEALDDPALGLEPHLTFYRELHDDPRALLQGILRYFGLDDVVVPELPRPEPGEHVYRRGELDEWRRVFTPRQRDDAGALVPDTLLTRFGWAR